MQESQLHWYYKQKKCKAAKENVEMCRQSIMSWMMLMLIRLKTLHHCLEWSHKNVEKKFFSNPFFEHYSHQ